MGSCHESGYAIRNESRHTLARVFNRLRAIIHTGDEVIVKVNDRHAGI
jgi:hypothetical protein